jgi:AcrR family transcriptional regulator
MAGDERELLSVAPSLTPEVTHRRARATVENVVQATAALLEEHDERSISVADIARRSGVSIGSLYHHFGDRRSILAAAQAHRYDASARMQLGRTLTIYAQGPDPLAVIAASERLVAGLLAGEHDADRRARIDALCAGRHRPALLDSLSASFRSLIDVVAAQVAALCEGGVLVDGIDPRAYAVFSQVYGAGLAADRLHPEPLPAAEWWSLLHGMVHASVVHDHLACPPRHEAAAGAGAAMGHRDPARSRLSEADRTPAGRQALQRIRRGPDRHELEVLDRVIMRLRGTGPDGIVITDVLAGLGVSTGWAQRRFGDRHGLVDAARAHLLLEEAGAESTLLEGAIDAAGTPEQLVGRLAELCRTADADAFRDHHWNRLEVMAAALSPDVSHRAALGEGIARTLARTTVAFERAQGRGIVAEGISPRAIARFVWGFPLGHLLARAAGVDASAWAEVLQVALGALVPPER